MIYYFTAATTHCECQKIRLVFKVLGMYDFALLLLSYNAMLKIYNCEQKVNRQ